MSQTVVKEQKSVVRREWPREEVNAARQAAEESRSALRQALEAFLKAKASRVCPWLNEQVAAWIREYKEAVLNLFQSAVRASVLVEGGKDGATRWGLNEADWQERQKRLPDYPTPPCLPNYLSGGWYYPETWQSQLAGNTSLAKMAEGAVDYLARYAEGLINNGLLGFVDYLEGDQAAYCYVLRRIKVGRERHKVIKVRLWLGWGWSSDRLPQFDRPKALYKYRKAYLKHENRWGSAVYWIEKHVHHLQQARLVPFQRYQEAMPIWAERVKEIVPEWLAPHLQVLEGKIVGEQVAEEDLETKQWNLPMVKDVSYDSPAFCLGRIVLTGWSSQDLVFRGDRFQMVEIDGQRYLRRYSAFFGSVVGLAVRVSAALGLMYMLMTLTSWPIAAVVIVLAVGMTFRRGRMVVERFMERLLNWKRWL